MDSHGKIYVANESGGPSGNGSVTVYAAGSSGKATPIATITGSTDGDNNAGLETPLGIVVDSSGTIYVANQSNSVTIYAAGSDGNVTPTTTIAGANTLLDVPNGIAVDSKGNIYVTNAEDDQTDFPTGVITVYPPGSNGDVAPIVTIGGDSDNVNFPIGIAVKP